MLEPTQPLRLGDRLTWLGLVVVTMLCLARAMIEHDPFPWWQSDPFVFSPPIVGLTPRWALLLNIALVLGSCISLLGHAMHGRGLTALSGVLLSVALVVLGYHAIVDLERLLDASTIAAVASVLACACMLHTLPGASRVVGSIVLGFALMLVCVGIYEVYVSHPQTLAAYQNGRESFLAARGWTPDSFEALSYERRLSNPEPVAWFGLTNVFASFAAAGGAGLFGVALHASHQPRWRRVVLLAAACLCGFGLAMSGSKGGYGVLLIGLGFALAPKLGKPGWVNGRSILMLCLVVLVALLARGVLGEQLGERSLLFRYQYLLGSISIWLHHPFAGCGPGQFQQQYALLKPALSPEDVASAHSFVFDWLALLGVGGLAFIAFAGRTIWGIETSATEETNEAEDGTTFPDWHWKFVLLVIALPVLMALKMQSPVLNLAGMLPILIGAALWAGVAMLLMRSSISTHLLRLGLVVTAGVLVVHGMLEVTGTLITSAPLWALMIGVACVGRRPSQGRIRMLPVACMLGLAFVLSVRWADLNRWERSLHSAARGAQTIASINSVLNDLETSPNPQAELRLAQQLLSDLLGRPISSGLDSIIPELNGAEVQGRQRAIELLGRSLDARPTHTPTRVALSQQMLWVASVAQSSGRDELARQMWDRATALFEGTDLDASGHRWAGSIWSGRASSWSEAPDRLIWLQRAQSHWEQALNLAPHSPQTAFDLMNNAIERDDDAAAGQWARRAIELHEETRLDPLRGLSPGELTRAEAIAAS